MNTRIIVGLFIILVIISAFAMIFILNDVNYYNLTIKFPNARKISKGDDVYFKGSNIGSVELVDFDIEMDSVIVEIKIHKKCLFPVDSDFFIKKDKLITSSHCIEVEKGESHEMLQDGDVIIGSLTFWQRLINQSETIINIIFKDHSGMKENVPFGHKEIRP